MSDDPKSQLRALALDIGFHDLRVTTPAAIGAAGGRLRDFLAAGRHGDMDWLARNADRRADPAVLWPDVRSIVMLGISYAPPGDPLAALAKRSHGAISCYAQGKDYHDLVKRGLIRLRRPPAPSHAVPT